MDNVECKYHFEKISSSSSFSNIYHQHVFRYMWKMWRMWMMMIIDVGKTDNVTAGWWLEKLNLI